MKKIEKQRGSVYGDSNAWDHLNELLTELQPSKIFILTDENTRKHCYEPMMSKVKLPSSPVPLELPAGEIHKNIQSCTQLWKALSDKGADRKSLLINLGGGVITDLGGFVACTYQRGIEFINIPTSLLAMVDASVGGKTGVDLGTLKNQVGIIRNPKAVIVDIEFLTTLPVAHFNSGMSEMIKHGLIHSASYLEKVIEMNVDNKEEVGDLVWESIMIKNEVITKDPFEDGLRKTLNYGHTLGHAIESYFLDTEHKKSLLHGEAIGIGMILANYISHKQLGLSETVVKHTARFIIDLYGKVHFSKEEIDNIMELMKHDKKNSHGKIRFVLLEEIGKAQLNCTVSKSEIREAFKFYSDY